jgi:hypothetical protein
MLRRVWDYITLADERDAAWFETTLPFDALPGVHGQFGRLLGERCACDPGAGRAEAAALIGRATAFTNATMHFCFR